MGSLLKWKLQSGWYDSLLICNLCAVNESTLWIRLSTGYKIMTKANAICSCYWHRARKYLFRSCILLLSVMCTITHTHTAHTVAGTERGADIGVISLNWLVFVSGKLSASHDLKKKSSQTCNMKLQLLRKFSKSSLNAFAAHLFCNQATDRNSKRSSSEREREL